MGWIARHRSCCSFENLPPQRSFGRERICLQYQPLPCFLAWKERKKRGVSGGEEGYNNVASAMLRFATSGNFTSNLAGENAGVISRAISSFILKEESRVVVNTENMNSLSALDHRRMENFLSLVKDHPWGFINSFLGQILVTKSTIWTCHQPHLAFLASQLIPHQMLSQSHSRCALIDYSERLFSRKILRFGLPLEALFWYLSGLLVWSFQYLVLNDRISHFLPHPPTLFTRLVFFPKIQWDKSLLRYARLATNKACCLYSSQEMRPRQLLSLLDKEKAQQPWSAEPIGGSSNDRSVGRAGNSMILSS